MSGGLPVEVSQRKDRLIGTVAALIFPDHKARGESE